MEPLVHIEHFGISFSGKKVIEDLSFDVHAGETFGLLGSNGSGKTTTIRALLGIYRADYGVLHINGKPFNPEDGDTLGYLPEERGLYQKEPVLEVMIYFGMLKGLNRQDARNWSQEYLQRVDLADQQKTQVAKLSGGQQQKVQLGVTIMNNPKLLILDEPTKGFDPVNRRLLMDIIEEQQQAGATVIMVTHQMEEVERLCDRVVLLKSGAVEAYGSVDEVQDSFGGRVVRLRYTGTIPESSQYQILRAERNYAELALADDADESHVLKSLVDQGVMVRDYRTAKLSLDEIFVQVYGDQGRGEKLDHGAA